MHRLLGDAGPISWQRAALWLSFSCTVLLVIPIYMLTLELFGEGAAWLACLLVIINPLSSYIVVNVLSESTFLLPWTFGLWAAIRFLRDGRLAWLLAAIGFGVAAYLTRPEGLLLAVALFATLLISPLFRATRFEWQRSLEAHRVRGDRSAGSGRPLHRPARRAGHQSRGSRGCWHWRRSRTRLPSSEKSRSRPMSQFFTPTGLRRFGCSRSCARP